jgi:hypothetical protein
VRFITVIIFALGLRWLVNVLPGSRRANRPAHRAFYRRGFMSDEIDALESMINAEDWRERRPRR